MRHTLVVSCSRPNPTLCGASLAPSQEFSLLGNNANTDQLTVLLSSIHTLKSWAGPGNEVSVWHGKRDYRISETTEK